MYWIRKKNIYEATRIVTFWLSPAIITMATFGCFLLFEGNLTPERTFVVLSTIIVIQVIQIFSLELSNRDLLIILGLYLMIYFKDKFLCKDLRSLCLVMT